MKKTALILLTFLSVFSCGNDIEFNSPALQGNKDGNLWRAKFYSADIDFGGFIIEGGNNYERVQLITSDDAPGTFSLGGDSTSEAIYIDGQGVVYSTANAPDPSLQLYPADGQIIVEDVENTTPKTVTGTFWFNAFTADGLQRVNFNEGVFYKVPLVGGLVSDGSDCLEATQASATAAQNYVATDPSMPDYAELCNAYKTALIAQMDVCGDSSGTIQMIIDSLGDCTP